MEMTSDGEKLELASADSYCEGFCFKNNSWKGTQVFAFLFSGFGGLGDHILMDLCWW